MKFVLRFQVLAMLLLCVAVCRAEKSPVTHDFTSMVSEPAEIALSNSNKVGVTPLAVYTCTGANAKTAFGIDLYHTSTSPYRKISINLPDANNFVTTSAIEDLASLQIWHYPQEACSNIILQLSRDSIHWTDAIVQDGMYTNSYINANFVPGRYFVRLTNTNGTGVSIYKIIYRFDSGCNCVLYIPE